MSRPMKRQRKLPSPRAASGCFSPDLKPFGGVQTHSCVRPLHQGLSGHPDVGQRKQRFLILGNAAPELLKYTAESLAGRVVFHELDGLALEELAPVAAGSNWLVERWLRGGFPRALLADDTTASRAWHSVWTTYISCATAKVNLGRWLRAPVQCPQAVWLRRNVSP